MQDALDFLGRERCSAILRTNHAAAVMPAMQAAVGAGFRAVEFTLTTPGALEAVAAFRENPELLVGVGTADRGCQVAPDGGCGNFGKNALTVIAIQEVGSACLGAVRDKKVEVVVVVIIDKVDTARVALVADEGAGVDSGKGLRLYDARSEEQQPQHVQGKGSFLHKGCSVSPS